MKFLSKSIEETAKIAANFAKSILDKHDFNKNKATLVGLYGELGAGKTTFMKYFAEFFGVEETIQSPTFVIMKIYNTSPQPLSLSRRGATRSEGGEVFSHLIHVDAYRIEKEEEMISLGWEKIIANPKNLICIEWPEKVAGIMPEHFVVKFEHAGEKERKISIT